MRTLSLNGEVGWEITTKTVQDFFAEKSDDKEIQVEINTPGGNLYDAYGIYDYLKKKQKEGYEVNTLAIGTVASAGIVILLAGTKRETTPNTSFLLHDVSMLKWDTQGTADEYRKLADRIEDENDRMLVIYAKYIPDDKFNEVVENMKVEKWLDADKMLEYNIVTSKISFENFRKNKIFTNQKNKEKMELTEIKTKLDNLATNLAKLVGISTPKNEMFKLKEGGDFEADELKEGATTTAEDGTYELEDGKKVTVLAGKITKIEEPVTEDAKDIEIASLKAQLADAKKLENKLNDAEAKNLEMSNKVKTLVTDMATIQTEVAKFNLPSDNGSKTNRQKNVELSEDEQLEQVLKNRKINKNKK